MTDNSKVDNSDQSSPTSRATSMAELLKKQHTQFVSVKKGEIVKGKVTKLSSSEILLDINAKTEAVVLEKDKKMLKQLLSLLQVGDEVTASVLNPESDMGFTVVSLRRFLEDTLWVKIAKLQRSQEKLSVIIRENTKGGFIVETLTGVTGFLPNSYVAITQNQQMIGKTIDVVIIELDRDNKKVVFSQKAVTGEEDFKKAKAKLKVNDTIAVKIINVTSFGIFVSVTLGEDSFIDGLIHISEISWEKVTDIAGMFSEGQEVEAVLIGFDNQAKRIDLSIKRLTADPFEEAVKAFPVDKKVTATVTDVTDQGVIVDLGTAEGMIKKDKVPPGITYAAGQIITATVAQIDTRKRKILLVPVLKEKPIGYR
jgi:small subunit ribosomal protein S1